MKRFYNVVSISEADDGFHILLDGKPVKTKSGASLLAANQGIAERVMQEWAAQGDEIIPDTMPFMQIISTVMDRVSVERDAMQAAVLKYLDTDLVCYIAEEPAGLVEMQENAWGAWRSWFEKEFNGTLDTTTGLAALKQSATLHDTLHHYVSQLDDDRFTVLQIITSVSGSVILATAFLYGAAKPQDVFEACYVEETYKDTLYDAEKYGSDPLTEKKQKAARLDIESCAQYLDML